MVYRTSLSAKQSLGSLLLQKGKIREAELKRALKNMNGEPLGRVLIAQKACTEDDVLDALAGQLGRRAG